jgi:integrase
MAYLVRDARSRSPYWYGVYLVISPGGQRRWVRKSTKKQKRSEAKEILDAWQKTADRAAAGNLDQARIREIVMETVERVTGKRTDSPTVSEWLERWIRTERGAVAGRTMRRYEQIVRDFLSSIGTQAQAPVEALTADTFLQFKERWLSGGRSPRTVNLTIKILKRPFEIALEEGLIDRNPVATVRPIRAGSAKKGVFSPEQIQRLLDIAEGDWKGLILSGYFTGGRLVDLARLTWDDIDLTDKTITFVQTKTGASVQIPIHQKLRTEYAIIDEDMAVRHRKLEERSLALHREIAQRIRKNPDLLTRVREAPEQRHRQWTVFSFADGCDAGMARDSQITLSGTSPRVVGRR